VANDDLAIREGARLRRGALDDPGSDAEVLRFEAGEALPRFYTDSGNALRLADQRDGHLLHSTALGWLVWNGTVWSDISSLPLRLSGGIGRGRRSRRDRSWRHCG